MPGLSRGLFLTGLALATVLADQLAKSMIVSTIGPDAHMPRIDIMGDWLSLEYAENRGAAFGLFAGLGPFLPWASLIIVAAMLARYLRSTTPPPWETIAIALIVGGAAANLIDRIRLGYVIDYVSVGIWPNFNVADSAITAGALIAIWGWLIRERRPASPRAG